MSIEFRECPAEALSYDRGEFDLIFARDILHHVDIPRAMTELARVAGPGCMFVLSEISSHRWTYAIRDAELVRRYIYPRIARVIYGNEKPYITADERKLSEKDVELIKIYLSEIDDEQYFFFVVTRLFSEKSDTLNKADRLFLRLLGRRGVLLGGRVVLSGRFA